MPEDKLRALKGEWADAKEEYRTASAEFLHLKEEAAGLGDGNPDSSALTRIADIRMRVATRKLNDAANAYTQALLRSTGPR